MPINIFNNQTRIKLDFPLDAGFRKRFINPIEKELRLAKDSDYNIIFMDDPGIKKLNKKYLARNFPTDVLSFKYSGDSADIFISVQTAKTNAALYKQEFMTEILRLIIHGLLHALDYTDYEKKEKERMWKKQEQVLKCIM